MIVMFSVAANASRHVLNEVATALDVGATVIPFRIEDTRPTGALHLHLGRLHWLDALSPPLEGHIDRLIDNARRNLSAAGGEPELPHDPPGEPPVQVEVPPPLPQPEAGPTGLRRRLAVTGLLAGAATAIAILALSLNGIFTAPGKVPGDQPVAREAPAPPSSPVAETKPATTPTTVDRPARPGKIFQDCAHCREMVVLAAGRFSMGADSDEHMRYAVPKERAERETPRHAVTFERPFALGKFAVTRAEYADFVNDTGYDSPKTCNYWDGSSSKWVPQAGRNWRQSGLPQTDRDPVLCVNGDDIDAYLRWIRQKTGRAYRLPSEAEWEYAARAGTTTSFYWGNDWTDACRFENVGDQSIQQARGWPEANPCRDGYVYTAPVGSFQPNPFGLYDMLGNARTRVADCVNQTYSGAPSDGSAWISGDCTRRIFRGGNWSTSIAFWVRSANRVFDGYSQRNNQAGFRVALPLP